MSTSHNLTASHHLLARFCEIVSIQRLNLENEEASILKKKAGGYVAPDKIHLAEFRRLINGPALHSSAEAVLMERMDLLEHDAQGSSLKQALRA